MKKRALITGWFSFEEMGATAGDILVRDTAALWLQQAGIESDFATVSPFEDGVDWRSVDPDEYSHVVFACGPFSNYPPVSEIFDRFSHATIIGLNLTMMDPPGTEDPFDLLWERNSSTTHRPDVVFITQQLRVPVVGLILVLPQEEYGPRALHHVANSAFERLIARNEMAVVRIDTRLDNNSTGLRSPGEVESLIAKMDVVLTTRLHGTVFAIKNGVPPIVIDPIQGGDKVSGHARAIGWRHTFLTDSADDEKLQQAFDYCLTTSARADVLRCRDFATQEIEKMRTEFIRRVSDSIIEAD